MGVREGGGWGMDGGREGRGGRNEGREMKMGWLWKDQRGVKGWGTSEGVSQSMLWLPLSAHS